MRYLTFTMRLFSIDFLFMRISIQRGLLLRDIFIWMAHPPRRAVPQKTCFLGGFSLGELPPRTIVRQGRLSLETASLGECSPRDSCPRRPLPQGTPDLEISSPRRPYSREASFQKLQALGPKRSQDGPSLGTSALGKIGPREKGLYYSRPADPSNLDEPLTSLLVSGPFRKHCPYKREKPV